MYKGVLTENYIACELYIKKDFPKEIFKTETLNQ